MDDNLDWGLVAATVVGALLVVATALLGYAAGLTGLAAYAAPLAVGVVIAAGITVRTRRA